jgi:hypothetical protein
MLIMARKYTPSEKEFIISNCNVLSADQIAKYLNRTQCAIEKWKIAHGLSNAKEIADFDVTTTIASMQSLIRLCETTTSPIIKQAAKTKLMELSGIPPHNPWSIDTVIRYHSRAKPSF